MCLELRDNRRPCGYPDAGALWQTRRLEGGAPDWRLLALMSLIPGTFFLSGYVSVCGSLGIAILVWCACIILGPQRLRQEDP